MKIQITCTKDEQNRVIEAPECLFSEGLGLDFPCPHTRGCDECLLDNVEWVIVEDTDI